MKDGPPPVTAYLALWLPKASETFVWNEAVGLWGMGLPLRVFTLYGPKRRHLSPAMLHCPLPVERLGIRSIFRICMAVLFWLRHAPGKSRQVLSALLRRRWGGFEKTGENLWALACAFLLARRFLEIKAGHIHACWAGGPATAAGAASLLTGIPYSFTGRAHDIFPADRAICEKIRQAALVRGESLAAVRQLAHYAGAHGGKILLTYNGMPLREAEEALVPMRPPYQIMALGRFVAKKGFDVLLKACALLMEEGVVFHLTLAGEGPRGRELRKLAQHLGLAGRVSFPGFVRHHQVSGLFRQSDVLVMPSVVSASGDRDGLPTVLLEALAHRVPVIASDVGGIGELVEDGGTGLLVPPGEPRQLAGALKRLFSDRTAALAMASRGRHLVRTRFDSGANNRRLLEVYRALSPERD